MIRDALRRMVRRVASPPAPPAAPTTSRPPLEPEPPEPELEIEAADLRRRVDAGDRPLLLDIREPYEVAGGMAAGALWIPMNQVPGRLAEIPRDRALIVYCAAGVRSYGVAHWLREQGYADAWSLVGGLGAWLDQGAELVYPEKG